MKLLFDVFVALLATMLAVLLYAAAVPPSTAAVLGLAAVAMTTFWGMLLVLR